MMTDKEIVQAKEKNIYIPSEVLDGKDIVGVYKIFAKKEGTQECLYVGKSVNVTKRLLGSDGHIYMYLNNNLQNLVPKKIDEYLKKGYKIEIEIIPVDYSDTSFSRAVHRLALVEILEIVKYQAMGQCLEQLPEGTNPSYEAEWSKEFKKYI